MIHFSISPARRAAALLCGATAIAGLAFAPAARAQEPAACLSADPNVWPAPSKPYFMLFIDTSGSMIAPVPGPAPTCAGYASTRMGHARCAVKNTVLAFSEVNYGLAQFSWFMTGCGANCYGNASGSPNPACTINCYAGDITSPPQIGFCKGCGPMDNPLDASTRRGGRVLVPMQIDNHWSSPPSPTNVPTILQYVDNNCTNNLEVGNVPTDGLAFGRTPLNGSLRDMLRYFQSGWTAPDNSVSFPTPLDANDRACRSVNVILLTDGDETCDLQSDAVAAAAALYNVGATIGGKLFRIRTHVINFAGGNQANTDDIADAGDDGNSANNSAVSFFATNEVELSSALATIIAGALRPEVCNNLDDNCNGCTDEGYKHYCDLRPACCTQPRATCLTQYQASITPGNPLGNLDLLPCTTVAQQTQPASWLCFDPKEVCDNLDNNCNAQTDEGFTKCGSPLACPAAEVCDGDDDDCDGIVDNASGNPIPFSLPGCLPCNPSAEICDGCDNDCNGIADDGVAALPCGFPTPPGCPSCSGTRACSPLANPNVPPGGCVTPPGNTFGTCNASGSSETCNSCDDNCDGLVDNGIPPTACEVPGMPGLKYQPDALTPPLSGGQTFAQSQCKRGTLPCNGQCTGYVGPSPEICDGIDNDCNGIVDDGVPGVGNQCGTAVGQCQKGTTACVGGVLVCQGGSPPQPEVCNGLDDDCDGTTDDAPLQDAPTDPACWDLPASPPCTPACSHQTLNWCPPPGGTCKTTGTLTAPCQTGTLVCGGVTGWRCQGGTVPSPEVCDGSDNDCNGQTDTPLGAPVGDACGSDVGECQPGQNICDNGTIVCDGEIGPTAEICDGKDNNCNNVVDDGIPIGSPCAAQYDTTAYPGDRTQGECDPGTLQCNPTTGQQECIGGTGPSPEICNGKDDDCDGQVDEPGPPPDGLDGTADPNDSTKHLGDECGVDEGECRKGRLTCVAGAVVCTGTVGPQPELCDCLDNDCDGQIDNGGEADGGPPICGGEKKCASVAAGVCQCAGPCKTGEFPCPIGTECKRVPISGSEPPVEDDLCVSNPCIDCPLKTVKNPQNDEVECAPTGNVPLCVCKGNEGCRSPCHGVTCPSGMDCARFGAGAGTCQPQGNCNFFGCPDGEACHNGACVDDPCEPNTCKAGEVCKPNATFDQSRCVGSCADVTCPSAQACEEGTCQPTGCAADCPPPSICLPGADGGGQCGPSKCAADAGLVCSDGSHCDPATGQCGDDPCTGVKCPTGQTCLDGECAKEGAGGAGGTGGVGGTAGTAGTGGSATGGSATGGSGTGGAATGGSGATAGSEGAAAETRGVWGLATGGGGCACRAPAGPRTGGARLGLLLFGFGLAFRSLRRRSRRSSVG